MPTRDRSSADHDLVRRYLPAQFLARIPLPDRSFRGRIVLLLWALGYPIEMAWSFGMTGEAEQVRFYKEALSQLDDERLIGQLDATVAIRGDGSHLEFLSFGGMAEEKEFWVLVRRGES